jgi:putative sterol carrier protein
MLSSEGENTLEVKTPKEFFEKTLPTKFNPDKAKGFEAVAQVNITGADGGNWIIIIKNQKIETKEGVAPSPAITLKVKDTDFVDLVNGKLNAVNAFMTGKLEFNGSMAIGLKLLDIGFM